MEIHPGDDGPRPEDDATATPEPPDFDQVLVRACVGAMWADGSMAAAERDTLSQVIASVADSKRERDRLRQLALSDLNRHEVLADVARLPAASRLHLFERCLSLVMADRKLVNGDINRQELFINAPERA